jgi:hypothetical protein
MTFTGRACFTRADAIGDLFLLPGRAFYVIPKPGKLSRSAIQLSVDSTSIRLFNVLKPTGPGRDAEPLPPSSAEVKNRVELRLYSP